LARTEASVRANSTAKLTCDDWVTDRATAYAELTQRGEGFGGETGSRHGAFLNLIKSADELVSDNSLGFKRMGIAVANPSSEGLYFTGLPAEQDRTDPLNPALEQPIFRRGQFNNREFDDGPRRDNDWNGE